MGRALPSRMFLSFVFPSFDGYGSCPLFPFLPFVRRVMGRRRQGIPHYDCASWSGSEKVILKSPSLTRKGQRIINKRIKTKKKQEAFDTELMAIRMGMLPLWLDYRQQRTYNPHGLASSHS